MTALSPLKKKRAYICDGLVSFLWYLIYLIINTLISWTITITDLDYFPYLPSMKVNSGLWLLANTRSKHIWEYDKNFGILVFSSSSRLKDWIAVMGCCIPTDRSNTSALHSRSPNYRKVKSRWKPTNPASNFLLPIPVIAKPWWNVQHKSGLQETNEKAQ